MATSITEWWCPKCKSLWRGEPNACLDCNGPIRPLRPSDMASINQSGPPAAGFTVKGKKRPRRESATARTEPFTGKKRKFKPDVSKSNVRTEKEQGDSAAGRGSAPGASGPTSQRGQDPPPVIVDDLAYTEYCLIHHDVGHPTRSCVHVKDKVYVLW